jgi:hypothetical protein
LVTNADNEYAMIDSTIVRAHQHSAGAKGGQAKENGRSRGGLSTKSTLPLMHWAIRPGFT